MSELMRPMNVVCYFFGFACGAAAMYFADPRHGRARRAMVRDKATRLAHQAQDYAEKTARGLSNRARGLVHETRRAVEGATGGQGEQTQGQQQAAPAM
jgi:hyperosmotically inducible protein